jgi:peptide/nickel transport system substrate-binding protein
MSEGPEVKRILIAVACVITGLTLAIPGIGSAQGRAGAWVDVVLAVQEPNDAAAVSRLEANDIQAWFSATSNPDLHNRIARTPTLTFAGSLGVNRELSFNPAGPVFPGTGRLNPLPRRRSAKP